MLSYMKTNKTEKIKVQIEKVKKELLELGDLRPGSVTKQIAKGVGKKPREYWQISYTHKMKSRTEYLRDEFVEQIKTEVLNHKKFKKLIEKWIELSIELSKEKIEILKNQQ
jgi:hypothetical protein